MHEHIIKAHIHTNINSVECVNINYILKSIPHKEYRINDDLTMYVGLTTITNTFTGALLLTFEIYDDNYDEAFDKLDIDESINIITTNLLKYINEINDMNIQIPYTLKQTSSYIEGKYLYAPVFNFETNSIIESPEITYKTFAINTDEIDRSMLYNKIKKQLNYI